MKRKFIGRSERKQLLVLVLVNFNSWNPYCRIILNISPSFHLNLLEFITFNKILAPYITNPNLKNTCFRHFFKFPPFFPIPAIFSNSHPLEFSASNKILAPCIRNPHFQKPRVSAIFFKITAIFSNSRHFPSSHPFDHDRFSRANWLSKIYSWTESDHVHDCIVSCKERFS